MKSRDSCHGLHTQPQSLILLDTLLLANGIMFRKYLVQTLSHQIVLEPETGSQCIQLGLVQTSEMLRPLLDQVLGKQNVPADLRDPVSKLPDRIRIESAIILVGNRLDDEVFQDLVYRLDRIHRSAP